MKTIALDRTYGASASIELKPGMAWMLYFDDGPGGPCGQDGRTTCPHAYLAIWPDEDAMREALKDGKYGRNRKARTMYGVVDNWSANGIFSLTTHEPKPIKEDPPIDP